MYNRTEQILAAYPKEFNGNSKGRGSILCTDSQGIYLLKEYTGSIHRLEVMEQVLLHLNEHGMLTEQIVRTSEGELCYRDTDGTVYFLREYVKGRECDTRNRDEILQAIVKLAKMHKVLEEEPLTLRVTPEKPVQNPMEAAGKHTRELKKVRNYIRDKKKENDFEREFLRSFNHYIAQANEVLSMEKELQLPKDANRICHGDYNQHNLLFVPDDVAIVGFEKLKEDLFVSDLTNFMRKILEKHNWNTGLGMDMIMTYNANHTLEPWELRCLYMKLLYPEKFWKIVNHYYNVRKTWISGRNIEKLVRLNEQEQTREEFLSMLFYLVK